MNLPLEGKSAIVTGASRGIGRAIAVDLARNGAEVALVGRSRETLEATASEIERVRSGARTLSLIADVTLSDDVERAVAGAAERFGRIDAAVACAGQAINGLLVRTKPTDFERMLDVNLKSAFYLVSAVSKPMMKQRAGSIVLVSSVVGLSGNVGQTAYAAAKAGLLGLAKSVAKELGSRNVRVNAVAPGLIETAMTETMSAEARNRFLQSTPLGRAGTPEDVSGVVTFLCSEAARYMTGQTLVVDGGFVM